MDKRKVKKIFKFLIYYLIPLICLYFFGNDILEYLKENILGLLFFFFLHFLAVLVTVIMYLSL